MPKMVPFEIVSFVKISTLIDRINKLLAMKVVLSPPQQSKRVKRLLIVDRAFMVQNEKRPLNFKLLIRKNLNLLLLIN